MADTHAKQHDYHLVNPSPWPFIGAMGALLMAIGGVAWMRYMQGGDFPIFGYNLANTHFWIFGIGLLIVLYTMFAWWSDTIKEAHEGYHTPVVSLHLRYGMIMFIASEVMFFVAWFWAFFDASLFPGEAIQAARTAFTGGVWPPKGIEVLDPFHLPLYNTIILLLSGTTVTWAHHALIHGNRKGLIWGSGADGGARRPVHLVPGLRVYTRAFRLQELDLRRDLLHGDGFPWLPRHHRDDLPVRLPDARGRWGLHAQAAFRLRGGCLVLAFRRCGLAVPVYLHLCVGIAWRDHSRWSNRPRRRALFSGSVCGRPWRHGRPYSVRG